jgi:uncharacterized membrane protein YeaQ/YmgE (transglycosylase-associated protein family)
LRRPFRLVAAFAAARSKSKDRAVLIQSRPELRYAGRNAAGSESMNEAQAFFSQPGVGFFTMLLIGAIAGWIAERVTSSNHGILTNILVGIAGAFVGAKLAELVQVPVFGFWRTLLSASVGAILILFIWRAVRR